MRLITGRLVLAAALAGGVAISPLLAQENTKALPSLLIKGEIVSLDTNDPAAMLLKVKDRYGFETLIFVEPDTAITQGEQALEVGSLSSGMNVEVEYHFDINTAKRHAVAVTVLVAEPAAPAAPSAVAPPAEVEAPAPSPAVEEAPAAPVSAGPEAPVPAQAPTPAEATPVAE
jgi:hypothetical protein